MSENGPREGTRDLPRRDPEAGRRAVDPNSISGRAYGSQARQLRRREAEVRALLEQQVPPDDIVRRYARDHPMEHPVTLDEVDALRGPPVSATHRNASRKAEASR